MESRSRPLPAPPVLARSGARWREVSHLDLTWVDLVQPTNAEIAQLRERFHFDPLALEDVRSNLERPKIDVYVRHEYVFADVQFPLLDREERIAAAELKLFIGRNVLVTIHDGDMKPLRRIFSMMTNDDGARAQLMSRGSGFIAYRLLDTLVAQCFPVLYRLDDELGRMDAALAKQRLVSARTLADVQREITAARHIITPSMIAMCTLRDSDTPFLTTDNYRMFGDIADAFIKLEQLVHEQRDTATNLAGSFQLLAVQEQTASVTVGITLLAYTLPLIIVLLIGSQLMSRFSIDPLLFTAALVLIGIIAGLLVTSALRRPRR